MRRRTVVARLGGAAAAVAIVASAAVVVPAGADTAPVAGRTVKLRLTPGGATMAAEHDPRVLAVSRHGRIVAFDSSAPNLVAGDANGSLDVFVLDRLDGSLKMVNRRPDGAQGDGIAYDPSLSDDGRFVAFASSSSDLVAGDTNGAVDIFVRDLATGTTERVSISSTGGQGASHAQWSDISGDGNVVAFTSGSNLVVTDGNGVNDVYVHDRTTNQTGRVSISDDEQEADGPSAKPALSHDGSVVAFVSDATDLIGTDTNGDTDVYVRDRSFGSTTRASITSTNQQVEGVSDEPDISADGRYVVFQSEAKDLAAGIPDTAEWVIFRRDRNPLVGSTGVVSRKTDGTVAGRGFQPSISADGDRVAWHNRTSDLVASSGVVGSCEPFAAVRDVDEALTLPVFPTLDGTACNGRRPAISADGRYVVGSANTDRFVPGEADPLTYDLYLRVLADSTFTDVPAAHTFFEPISWLVDRGITKGYPNGTFGPAATVTRQAIAAFLYRYAGSSYVGDGTPTFSDVPTNHPFYDEIEWMVAEGLAQGYGDGTFRGGAPISRQAMAAFLHRFAEEPPVVFGPEPAFDDVPPGHPFRAPIEWMAAQSIANGYPDGGFHPGASITRQAAAAFLFRYGWWDRVV